MYNERDDKEMTLKSKGQDKDQLVNKILGYNIDKIFKIPIPPKRVKKTEEQKKQKKKQDQEKIKEERRKRKPFLPYIRFFGQLQREANGELSDNKFEGVEDIIEKMKEKLEEKYDEIVEDADEKDIELDDDLYDDLETEIGKFYTELRQRAKEKLKK